MGSHVFNSKNEVEAFLHRFIPKLDIFGIIVLNRKKNFEALKLLGMTELERKEVIKRFLKNYTEQDFINICNIANSSDFLSGRTE